MIFDSIDHRSCYEDIPGLKDILEALSQINAENIPAERVVLHGDDSFINPVSFTSKKLDETKFEAHRRYADIHYVLAGEEEIIVNDVNGLDEVQKYSDKDDVGFYMGDKGTVCVLKPGDFLVCFPQDAHRVCIAPCEPAPVRKLVGKLRVK